MKKNQNESVNTVVECPVCHSQFKIGEHQHTVKDAVVIGKDSGLGTIQLEVEKKGTGGVNVNIEVNQNMQTAKKTKAMLRMDALRAAGVDTSRMCVLNDEQLGKVSDGKLVALADDDPIFASIESQRYISNYGLFRRWISSQVMRILANTEKTSYYGRCDYRAYIRRLGYEYQWRVVINEFNAQKHMRDNGDIKSLEERQKFFNTKMLITFMEDYMEVLSSYIYGDNTYQNRGLKVRKCKGVDYIRLRGQNIFKSDLYKKVFAPLYQIIRDIKRSSQSLDDICFYLNKFNNQRYRMKWDTKFSEAFIDAYKGAGAYFTLQNLIRFSGVRLYDAKNRRLSAEDSEKLLVSTADMYAGYGWKLWGFMKEAFEKEGLNPAKKLAEWRNNK